MQRNNLNHQRIRSRRWDLLTLALAVVLPVSLSALAVPPTDEQRLERLAERLESARIEQHVPGMAVAVVKDDKVIFARGFGFANIAEETKVTPETIFAIGSSTKAFTATTIGMLVDEGLMTWDDPVSKWLPYFNPAVTGDEEAQILVRDMLCHRTGFTRMSILWVNGKVSRETILHTANHAEPWAEYREKFLYNNVMLMAAGMCAGVAADSTWEMLIQQRIFDPLGMDDSSLTYEAAQADSRLALGYNWKSEEADWEHAPMRNIDVIGPAGSINSNVLDMARWVRFQLGRGEFESRRLLSEETHAETWIPQMKIAGPVSYGFGWMLREWRDRRVIEHGGNIDGFAAQVALLPEENLGFVLLSNTGYAPIQQGSIGIIFDAMAGDWEPASPPEGDAGDDGNTADADIALDELTGVYIANYATFQDEHFTVSIEDDGRLAIDIPSQMKFALDPPGEDGRRPFADQPGIAATFERDDDGEVVILRLYQNRLKFDVPREGYEFPVEFALDELEKYTGKYRFESRNVDVTVLVKNNHLAVDVPNQMVFELHPPDEEDKWQFRNNDVKMIAVSFSEGEFGAIESMTMYESGQQFEMPRNQDTEDLLSLEEVFDLARLDERQDMLASAAPLRYRGKARFAQSGVAGTHEMIFDASERYRSDLEFGKFGSIHNAVNRDEGWSDLSFREFDELKGRWLDLARLSHPAIYLGDWRPFLDEIRVTDWDEIEGRKVIVLEMRHGDLPLMKTSIDAETGDILKIDAPVETPELPGIKFPSVTFYRDWRETGGIRVPHTIVLETEQNGRLIMTITEVETDVTLADDAFILSREEK